VWPRRGATLEEAQTAKLERICRKLDLRPEHHVVEIGTRWGQAIVTDDRSYAVEKAARTFIRTYIFPNGCLPSQEVIARCVARRTHLRAVHVEDLTPHYVQTLRAWRAIVERSVARLAELATTSASAGCGAVPCLLRGRVRRAPDRARAVGARQAAGARRDHARSGRGARARGHGLTPTAGDR
jgi:cyclopropane fatty-acyl-phospholipid synthase-like methyltransferase